MKLKETLAEEYCSGVNQEWNRELKKALLLAYLQGFEKAREMAILEATRFSEEPEALDIEVRIIEIGEEEVKR